MTPFITGDDLPDTTAESASVPFSGEMGVPVAAAREAIYALARHAGYESFTLIEWSGAEVPGAVPPGEAPLYYAVLLTGEGDEDVPVGLGDTRAAALSDLLWSLGAPVLLDALSADEPEPEWLDGDEQRAPGVSAPPILH